MSKFEEKMDRVFYEYDLIKKKKDGFNHVVFKHHLDNCIVLCRSVTFVMQKTLRHKPGFLDWYKIKQEEMKQKNFDLFVKRRNKIEKEGKDVTKSGEIKLTFHGTEKNLA